LGSGAAYRLIALPPELPGMTPEVLRTLRGLVAGGATLVGPKPNFSPSLRDYPASSVEVRRLADEIWGQVRGAPAGEHLFGKGKVIWGRTPADVLRALAAPDFESISRGVNVPLGWLHRRLGSNDVYFVANRQRQAVETIGAFRVSGKRPEL